MSLFNEKIKNITLKELLIVMILLFLIQFFINSLNIVHIDSVWFYICIIFYFIFKLRPSVSDIKGDVFSVFSKDSLKAIGFVVVLNIFLSYGLLYLSDYLLIAIPGLDSFLPPASASNSFVVGGLFSIIVISPLVEELVFRGVFLNRLRLIVPTLFAVLISSVIFASLHNYGSIIAAFVFSICMAILYLKTDNVFVPIFAHFLNNLLAEIIVILDVNKILFTNSSVVMTVSVLAVISAILLTVSIIKELNSIK